MWQEYYTVRSLEDALAILSEKKEKARIVAGATDLILEIERGVRKGIEVLVDLRKISGLNEITLDEDEIIHLGPLVTHSQCVASKLIVEQAYLLARACMEVGAPQIRNRGTVAGNLITASPANDTIAPLMAMGASVVLASARGERKVPLEGFYKGVRQTVMQADEVLVDIQIPALQANQRGTFYKLGLRRAQAISVVNAAVLLTIEDGRVKAAAITLGAVTPTIARATQAEEFLVGRDLNTESIEQTAELAMQAARPIDDVRSSKDYRLEMVRVCVLRALRSLVPDATAGPGAPSSAVREGFPERPVLLRVERGRWGNVEDMAPLQENLCHRKAGEGGTPIIVTINGKPATFTSGQNKTLLRLLREEAGLIGTKEGCAEGECGACTVFLDGMAVMSCLVPAPQAHGAQVYTIEGLAHPAELHPVQKAFIEEGAVQCGYCTPGFVMSAAMLLEEIPHPTREEIKQAVSGNLCRCTGYYSIINAIEKAALRME
ncbi:MAG: FAD binding domain-containing protein [Anaerolineales bacterium]|nr:FAD binding domain-containing protein [Anaerolineales bacterium]